MGSTNDGDILVLLESEPSATCYFCNEKFNNLRTLKNHIEINHLSSSITDPLTISPETHTSNIEKLKIIHSPKNIEPFNERNKKITKKKNKNSEKDKSVLVDKSDNNDQSLYCVIDNDNITNKTILQNTCKICNKVLKNKKSVYRHVKTVHSNTTALCPDCGKQFSNQRYMDSHRTIVHSVKRVQCLQCKKYFSNNKYLLFHKTYIHSTASVTCNHCNKIFKHKKSLRKHEGLEHSSTKQSHKEISYAEEIEVSEIKFEKL